MIYLCESPELVADDDAPMIPPRYHPLWIDFAVVNAYKDSDNFAAAQALRADIYARLQDLIARYEVRNRQHAAPISVRYFSRGRLRRWHDRDSDSAARPTYGAFGRAATPRPPAPRVVTPPAPPDPRYENEIALARREREQIAGVGAQRARRAWPATATPRAPAGR